MNATTLSSTSTSTVSHLVPTKRPRPIVRRATEEDLAWDPIAVEQFTVVDGQNVRSGESYAIVRPGMERWPLGHVSDHYIVTSHRATAAAIKEFCADVATFSGAIVAGHGYHVAHSYEIRMARVEDVAGAPVRPRLIISSSHTGGESLRAAMVVYIGKDALGAVVRSKALHVAGQPSSWTNSVEAMVEKAICVQDALVDLLKAADAHELTDEDRAFFKGRKMVIKKDARTALDAVRSWTRGTTKKITWGVWERRLDDAAICALLALLARHGNAKHGAWIDGALGYSRPVYARLQTKAAALVSGL